MATEIKFGLRIEDYFSARERLIQEIDKGRHTSKNNSSLQGTT